jgi:asparagine synthase (glutamine-hydrolysing)
MAHVAFLHEADAECRRRFAANVRRLFSQLPGTTIGEALAGPLTCVWVTGPRAPVDLWQEGDRLAVLIGYAVDDDGRWVTADQLSETWFAPKAERRCHDGYHVGIAYDPAKGLVAGGDPLGMFPLYHATLPGGATIIASTPEAFACHPAWSWRMSRTGLAGILFAHGPLHNQPLAAGVRRVPAGHRLRGVPGRGCEEVEVFRITTEPPAPAETSNERVERIDAEWMAAVRRHRPPGDDTVLMLSGGLDSRLVAGSLADQGIPTKAVTFGRSRDFEVRAARRVADQLAMPIDIVGTENTIDEFVARGRQAVKFNHLSAGLSGDDFAIGLAESATTARFCWSGIPMDWVFEPVSEYNGFDVLLNTWSGTAFLEQINAWGVPAAMLPALLGSDGEALCEDVIQRLVASCEAGDLPPERQSSLLRWDQRVRNHLAAALHLTSFTVWPLMIATDRRFFTAAFSLPLAACRHRGIEKAILLRRCPDLAAIPLDTNSFRFDPLQPRAGGPVVAGVQTLVRQVRRAMQPFMPGSDPRRYERLFNVDSPRWRAVRRAVEPLRPLLEEHLCGQTLAHVLPPPAHSLRSRKPLAAGSPIRLLAGLAFVLDHHRL